MDYSISIIINRNIQIQYIFQLCSDNIQHISHKKRLDVYTYKKKLGVNTGSQLISYFIYILLQLTLFLDIPLTGKVKLSATTSPNLPT